VYITKPMYLNMNEKPSSLIIFIRNVILSLLVIAALSAMDTLQASQTKTNDPDHYDHVRLNDVASGSLLFSSDLPGKYIIAPVLETNVDMVINGIVLRATVTQTFKNESDLWVEGIYVFPLPENAAVDQLNMQVGERRIKGFIQERQKAKQIYLKAKLAGKKAAIVEQQRPNMFTNSVANIAPHESITITIEYQQKIRYEKIDGKGQFSLRFPTTITPRYIPGKPKIIISENIGEISKKGWALNTDQVIDAADISPPMIDRADRENRFKLNIEIDAGFEIESINSPYHNISVHRPDNEQVIVTLQDSSSVSNRDFVLSWEPTSYVDPKAAIFSETLDKEFYQFIMVMPPSSAMQGAQALAREVIYIIDTSGSMSGESIQQAKASLQFALDRLRASDKFNIIQFNSSTSQLFESARMANSSNIRKAHSYVHALIAEGGTEMLPALKAAFGSSNNDDDIPINNYVTNHVNNYVRQVMFLTDGAVANEQQLFSYIQQHLGDNRLFTIGIGSAPNSHFMRKAAAFGRGTFTYIGAVSEVQQKLEQLFVKLESPVLRNLKLSWPSGIIVETWPQKLPDLYLGEPLYISIKSTQKTGSVSISGMRANVEWRMELPLIRSKISQGIAALWAKNKISALLDQMLVSPDKIKIQTEITNVALQHHLVSRYTSLVAVDITPTRPSEESLFTGPMPLNHPAGYHQKQLLGRLASTATSAPMHFIVGAILLLLALMRIGIKRRKLTLGTFN